MKASAARLSRRQVLGLGLAGAASLAAPRVFAQNVAIKFTLDWRFQGVHAAFLIADAQGFFREEGLNVQIDTGDGSAGAVQRVISNAYDAGFGDSSTMIQVAAREPGTQPLGIYMLYNRPPFVMISHKSKNITTPQDLIGKNVVTTANSSARTLFPALAKAAGIDANGVNFQNVSPQLMDQMLVRGEVDALAGFITTAGINLQGLGAKLEDYNVMYYADFGLAVYSNTVMVSRQFLAQNRDAVGRMVRAINRGYMVSQENPEAGVEALLARDPLLDRNIELMRLNLGLQELMITPETQAVGMGDVDPARFARAIDQVVETFSLPATPTMADVFSSEFLPPKAERMVKA